MDIYHDITYKISLPSGDLEFKIGDILSNDYSILKNSVFITANNPKGINVDNNLELNDKLLNDITPKFKYFNGNGGDDSHIEYHYLILDMSQPTGLALAIKYKQLAYIYIDEYLNVSLQIGI